MQKCQKPSTSANGNLPSTCFGFATGFDTAIAFFIQFANVVETPKTLQYSTNGSALPDPYSPPMVNPAFSLALLDDIICRWFFQT